MAATSGDARTEAPSASRSRRSRRASPWSQPGRRPRQWWSRLHYGPASVSRSRCQISLVRPPGFNTCTQRRREPCRLVRTAPSPARRRHMRSWDRWQAGRGIRRAARYPPRRHVPALTSRFHGMQGQHRAAEKAALVMDGSTAVSHILHQTHAKARDARDAANRAHQYPGRPSIAASHDAQGSSDPATPTARPSRGGDPPPARLANLTGAHGEQQPPEAGHRRDGIGDGAKRQQERMRSQNSPGGTAEPGTPRPAPPPSPHPPGEEQGQSPERGGSTSESSIANSAPAASGCSAARCVRSRPALRPPASRTSASNRSIHDHRHAEEGPSMSPVKHCLPAAR